MATEFDRFAVRLARMKALLEALESDCAGRPELHAHFLELRREMEAARAGLELLRSPETVRSMLA